MDGFDWKGIALGAIGGAVAGGLSGVNFAANAVVNTAVRVAIGNAVSQGIGVATGLQREFNWKAGGRASAVGGAIGQALGDAMGLSANGGRPAGMEVGEFVAKASLKGFVAGLTTAVARGGTVSGPAGGGGCVWQCVGGKSLAGAALDGSQQDGKAFRDGPDQSDAETARLNRYAVTKPDANTIIDNRPVVPSADAGEFYDRLVGIMGNSSASQRDPSNDVLLAAGPEYKGLGKGTRDELQLEAVIRPVKVDEVPASADRIRELQEEHRRPEGS